MTLVCARISDTSVAGQYFTATRALEAGTPTATTHTDASVRHAADLHRRLLGNGHCTRPLELDCRFQTICEGCGFFQTGPQFIPILRRQRDDAHTHTTTLAPSSTTNSTSPTGHRTRSYRASEMNGK